LFLNQQHARHSRKRKQITFSGQSQWPWDLWHRSAAAWLQNCEFKSYWGHGCSSLVLVVCCVGSSLCDELIIHSEESYRVCNLETSTMRWTRLYRLLHHRKKVYFKRCRQFHLWRDYYSPWLFSLRLKNVEENYNVNK
jgi:hypothetical protein